VTAALFVLLGVACGVLMFSIALVIHRDLRSRRHEARRFLRAVGGAVETPRGGDVVRIDEARRLRSKEVA
jgi:hypothetical protein